MNVEKSELVFCVWTDSSDSRYPQTYVRVWKAFREEVASVREGAIDNKDGYGSEDGASYWLSASNVLAAHGHTIVYRSSSSYGPELKIRWQHYNETEFCAPNFENLGRGYSEMKSSMAMLDKIGRSVEAESLRSRKKEYEFASRRDVTSGSFEDPHALVAALRRMRITEVEELKVGVEKWNTVHVVKRPRGVEYTLTACHSAGMEASA